MTDKPEDISKPFSGGVGIAPFLYVRVTDKMKINDLYELKPESVLKTPEILVGARYNHVKEANIEDCEFNRDMEESQVMEIRLLKDWDFDTRRIWRLATVWMHDKPVMVIQNAGREGDDHAKRFITDINLFKELCVHVREFYTLEPRSYKDIYNPNDEVEGLTEFYNNSLDDDFREETLSYYSDLID